MLQRNQGAISLSGQVSDQEHDVEDFIQTSGVDEKAAAGLREVPHELQQQIMSRGPLEGKNPSAMLIGRLRDAKRVSLVAPAKQFDVERFISEEGVDEKSASDLRDLPPALQQQVILRGTLSEGRNPSAMLIGRIRDAKKQNAPQASNVQRPMMQQMQQTNTMFTGNGAFPRGQPGIQTMTPARIVSTSAAVISKGRFMPAMVSSPRPHTSAIPRGTKRPISEVEPDVQQFIIDEGVDEVAGDALRELSQEEQQEIISRGKLSGRNPSAMLIGRIRDVKRSGILPSPSPPVPAMSKLGYFAETSELSPNVENFIQTEGVDEKAAEGLRDLPPHLQAQVIGRGSLSGGKNPSAMLNGRVRDAKKTSGIDNFLQQHCVDELAAQSFRELPQNLQEHIIGRGSLAGQNPSAILIGRIRDTKREFGLFDAHPPKYSAMPIEQNVEQFLADNGIDETAGSALRECTPEMQQQILSRGACKGNNPSAMLIGRVRDAKRQTTQPTFGQVVEQFIRTEGLDERAAESLRTLPAPLQQEVIGRGTLAEGKNPSAMLIGRVRDTRRAFGMIA